jgi:hypothetical protein
VEDGLWSPSYRQLFIDWVIAGVKHSGCALTIKLHPRDDLAVYTRLVEKYTDFKITLTKNSDLQELLRTSDIVITVNSTAGLWALAYGKCLLIAKCFAPKTTNVLENMAISVNQINDLPKILAQTKESVCISEHATAEKILADHIYTLDGEASKRIAGLVVLLAKQGSLGGNYVVF